MMGDTDQDFLGSEGLDDIIRAACLEPLQDVLPIGQSGNEDYRHVGQFGYRLEALANRDAIEFRHHDVEQDQVRPDAFANPQRRLAIGRGKHLVALGFKRVGQYPHIDSLIVDHENPGHDSASPGAENGNAGSSNTCISTRAIEFMS